MAMNFLERKLPENMRNFSGYEAVIFAFTIGILCDMQVNSNNCMKPKYKSCGKLLVGDDKANSKSADKKFPELNQKLEGVTENDGLVNCHNKVGTNEVI